MDEHHEESVETPDVGGVSMMEALREKHAELHRKRTIFLELPGYGNLLIAEYRVLDVSKEINRISRKVAQEFSDQMEQALYGSIDAMIAACVQLHTTRGEERVPLSQAFGPDAPPVRFDKRLAEFMGWDPPPDSAREVVLRLFDDIEPMILDHGQLISRWMSNVTRQVNDTFAGNL